MQGRDAEFINGLLTVRRICIEYVSYVADTCALVNEVPAVSRVRSRNRISCAANREDC